MRGFVGMMGMMAALALSAGAEPDGRGLGAIRDYAAGLEGERRAAAEFLIEHLPQSDREDLEAALFRENLEEACLARETYPWTKALPQELFFNEVLPHAVVNETRDAWRKRLRGLFAPKLAEARTLEDACAVVGANVKELTGVEYNTRREKACQSPAESMRQGMASCTGLSILMVDALRAVGVPARLAAIPLWGTKEGNHTWVEVHDGEGWRFTGYGGMPDRWDQGWEIPRCAYCDPMEPIHGVFASSYRPTGIGFPMIWEWRRGPAGRYCEQQRDEAGELTSLVWTLQEVAIGGVDRTRHYLKLAGGRKLPIPEGKACVVVRAFLEGGETRVDLPLRVRRGEELLFDGRTASEALDLNDYVRVLGEPGEWQVGHRTADGKWTTRRVEAVAGRETAVRIEVTEARAAGIFSIAQRRELATWFRGGGGGWPGSVAWPQLADAEAVVRARDELWSIYRDARRLDPASKELGPLPPTVAEAEAGGGLRPGSLTIGEDTMPFLLIRKETGEVPEGGRALYICMHGGGGNARAEGPHAWEVNTREWRAQAGLAAKLYAGEGIFFVPRMADDRRGRWHFAHNQDAFDRVIEHAIREWGVDPDRVYLMGISEGCYGTQILAPHMADRFGGACAMAGGIGEDVPLENLRNLAIRTEVGENDTTFDRVGLARRYHERLRGFAEKGGGYPNVINVQPGRGHGIDYAPGPEWMVRHRRDARPETVVWTAAPHDGRRRPAFYWLGLSDRGLEGRVKMVARLEDGGVKLSAEPGEGGAFGDSRIQVMLDDGMVDLDAPLMIEVNGEERAFPPPGRSVEALARTLVGRGDPKMCFPAVVELKP